MKNPSRFFVGCSLLVLLFIYGCGYTVPEAELQAAQQAMEQAKKLHAEDLAPSEWKDAIVAWEQAQAAVSEKKPAKSLFIKARSRFEKAVKIANANAESLRKEVTEMQTTIGERSAKVKAALDKGNISPRIKNQVSPIIREVDQSSANLDDLIKQGDLLKARTLAREIQKKVFNAELILAGKKPAS